MMYEDPQCLEQYTVTPWSQDANSLKINLSIYNQVLQESSKEYCKDLSLVQMVDEDLNLEEKYPLAYAHTLSCSISHNLHEWVRDQRDPGVIRTVNKEETRLRKRVLRTLQSIHKHTDDGSFVQKLSDLMSTVIANSWDTQDLQ